MAGLTLGLIYGFLCGTCVSSVFWWNVFRNLSRRVSRNLVDKALSEDLERRRESTDFGTVDVIPLGAGPSAQENVLFAIRPGALESNRRLNDAERVDSQPISRTLDYVVEDHSEETDER